MGEPNNASEMVNGEAYAHLTNSGTWNDWLIDATAPFIMEVNMTEKMKFTIPISLEGEAEGVKEGGVLSQILTTIDVNCLPTSVPDNILVDISNMEETDNILRFTLINQFDVIILG